MKSLLAATTALLLMCLSSVALAFTAVGPVQIASVSPRIGGETAASGTYGFFIFLTTTVEHTCSSQSPTQIFGVDEAFINDARIYRDHVNSLMLAYALGHRLTLYIDG